MRHRTSAIAAMVVTALLATACASSTPAAEETPATSSDEPGAITGAESDPEARSEGGQIIYAAEQEPAGFNYNTSKDNSAVTRDIISSIHWFAVKSAPDGSLVYPGLEGEPELISEDPQVVEWVIADGSTWSDGSPVTTADIEFFHESLVDPDNDVAARIGYDQIESLEIVDEQVFRATFATAYGDFRGMWQAVPQAAFIQDSDGGWDDALTNDPGPSAGPYMLESWNRGVDLALVPNPEWNGEVQPSLERIVFRFLPESATLPTALRNGEVDLIQAQAQIDLQAQLEQIPDATSEVLFRPAFEHLVLNLAHDVVGDLAVRQAIAHAMDRNGIVEALVRPFSPDAERLDNLIYTDVASPHYLAQGETYADADPDAAIAVLEEAGWVEGADGVRERDGQRLSIEFSTTAGNERREQTLVLIQNQLRAIGMEVVIDAAPQADLFSERLPAGQFEVTLKSFTASPFAIADATARFATGGGDNYGEMSNPEFDDLAGAAAVELDPDAQAEIGHQMGDILWDELTMIPIYQLPQLIAFDGAITGVAPNGTREGLFWNAEAWGRADS